ncbi:hypothetical protein [Paenibacillus sp. L3-i20]|uniref:hypothetical protein n=1 Tax=Paenibacillus sp. L3-i20 TaxID=2905833 RepID=UPI001EE0041A|nr:hypothetical protein [Paenibacillus sp. L3-i20]GKU79030.1 hypothetical protein L3i20_v234270 [Paenibacillus sp. L3-i20]
MCSIPPSRTTHLSDSFMCTLKELPSKLQVKAAAKAIEINPENAPKAYQTLLLSQEEQSNPLKLALRTTKRWSRSGVNLTVGFFGNPSAELKARIISHMNAWNVSGNIQFTESSNNPLVRVSFDGEGYWSYNGTDILQITSDQPTMNLEGFTMDTPEYVFQRVVRHETGHTLGFPHEHLRPEIVNLIDSEKAIAYFADRYKWSREKTKVQVLTPLDPFVNVTVVADPNSIMCYKLPASIMKDGIAINGGTDISASDMQLVAISYPKSNATKSLMHTVRNSDGSWQPLENLLNRFSIESPILSLAGAKGENGDTHLVFATIWGGPEEIGQLWHSIRLADGSWSGPNNLSQLLEISKGVAAVAAASGPNGTIQFIFTTSDGHLWHTIRESNGNWQPIGDLRKEVKVSGNVVALSGTGGADGATQFVFTTNDGHLWHTIRRANGSWQPLGNLSAELSTKWTGVVTTIAGAEGPSNGDAVFVFATNQSNLWHTIRYRNGGKWTGLNDLGKELQVEKRVIAIGGCSGADGQTQFVFTTQDGQAWHTIRYANGGWQSAVPLNLVLPIIGAMPTLTGVTGDNGATHFFFTTYQ